MRNSFRFSIFTVALVAIVTFFDFPVLNGQEAKTETELPSELTAPARTPIDAVDQQTEAVKAAAESQKKAAEDNTAAIKEQTEAQKAAAEALTKQTPESKPEPAFYQGFGFWVVVIIFAGLATSVIKRKVTGKWFIWLLAAGLSLAALPRTDGAVCTIPAGQPFVISGFYVVPDSANPNAPKRDVIMPDQERKFMVKGCGFGFDMSRVVVGFSGTGMNVHIDAVTNDTMIIRVKPDASAAFNYRNLAVAVTDRYGAKNLLHSPFTLEVAPPASYWTLQALEQRPVGQVRPQQRVSTIDQTARAAATAAAHNAATANDTVKGVAENAAKLAESVMQAANAVSKMTDNMKSMDARISAVEGGLTVQGDAIRQLRTQVDDLSSKQSPQIPPDNTEDVNALKIKVADLDKKLNLICSVTVGTFRKGTICDKAGVNTSAPSPQQGSGPVRNQLQ